MNERINYLMIAAVVLVADQFTKAWAAIQLKDGPSMSVIRSLFSLEYTENRGIALGIFGDGSDLTKWMLVAVSLAAALFVLGYILRASLTDRLLLMALSLLLAGIFGNLIDRLWHGYVIDFIFFHYDETWRFPVFNVADTAISFGAALMAIDLFRGAARSKDTIPIPPVPDQTVEPEPMSNE